MTITITPPHPNNNVGPGSLITWATSVGSIPSTAAWKFLSSFQEDLSDTYFQFLQHYTGHELGSIQIQQWTIFDTLSRTNNWFQQGIDGNPFYVEITLQEPLTPFTVYDTGTQTFTWQNDASTWGLLQQVLAQNPPTATLSPTQATQLANSSDNSDSILAGIKATITSGAGAVEHTLGELFSQHTLDLVTLVNLTPGGPTGSPVTSDISGTWVAGIIVRIATLGGPPAPGTPDNDWNLKDYAVLRIFRGTDLVKRVPIHNSSHFEYPLPGYAWGLIGDIMLGSTPPWTSIEVDFAPGVTGSVYAVNWFA